MLERTASWLRTFSRLFIGPFWREKWRPAAFGANESEACVKRTYVRTYSREVRRKIQDPKREDRIVHRVSSNYCSNHEFNYYDKKEWLCECRKHDETISCWRASKVAGACSASEPAGAAAASKALPEPQDLQVLAMEENSIANVSTCLSCSVLMLVFHILLETLAPALLAPCPPQPAGALKSPLLCGAPLLSPALQVMTVCFLCSG